MKKIFISFLLVAVCAGFSGFAARENLVIIRAQNDNTTNTTAVARSANVQSALSNRAPRVVAKSDASRIETNAGRAAVQKTPDAKSDPVQLGTVAQRKPAPRAPINITNRAADISKSAPVAVLETKTGAEYEVCKKSYFDCMDQFCKLKNDNYRRCSCNDKIYEFEKTKSIMDDAGVQLTTFTENLDTVGMTAAQSAAMRKASEGENALTSDSSASKALLQAIMNSIRGEDTNVGGKYSALNSVNMSFDTANSFGTMDAGQAIAAYNGKNLYSAIYGQCRNAVKSSCTDAQLQRAITAYLMAIEQDCNTVQTNLDENKKKMVAGVREGGAMLDLARVENRQKLNSDDMTACLTNVENAVLSTEVCGPGYRKCLDNGQFIDISTGAPIAGVIKFYELENLLSFNESLGSINQKLSKNPTNRLFVQNFESRVKKFAQPALDKCTENADSVWADYMDKAMLDIYYAQKSKVAEIKQGCFDFVSACYMNGDTALTTAMSDLTGNIGVVLQPDKISLNAAVCKEYVSSCDNMFDGNIVKEYVENRKDTDTLTACRAVVQQCFDKFGGNAYENFYYPFSGLFKEGEAADWFALCDGPECTSYKSQCAKQLAQIDSCNSKEMMVKAFGGLDYLSQFDDKYGLIKYNGIETSLDLRALRPTGVASEVYYQIIDILSTQCNNLQGRFIELQFMKTTMYKPTNWCISTFDKITYDKYGRTIIGEYEPLMELYGIVKNEDMCPKDYKSAVDIKSWGACLCWENGARRSEWGQSVKCTTEMPILQKPDLNKNCPEGSKLVPQATLESNGKTPSDSWCSKNIISDTNQVCPFDSIIRNNKCWWNQSSYYGDKIPAGIW